MDKNAIIDKLIVLRDTWYETEKTTGVVEWGECAYEIDVLIEKAAEGYEDEKQDYFGCNCGGV